MKLRVLLNGSEIKSFDHSTEEEAHKYFNHLLDTKFFLFGSVLAIEKDCKRIKEVVIL